MELNGTIAGFTLAIVLVLSGITLLGLDDDATVDPFEQEAEGPLEEGAEEEHEALDASWWLGVGAMVAGVLVGTWAWWSYEPGAPEE